jgi:hypothetical protein
MLQDPISMRDVVAKAHLPMHRIPLVDQMVGPVVHSSESAASHMPDTSESRPRMSHHADEVHVLDESRNAIRWRQ